MNSFEALKLSPIFELAAINTDIPFMKIIITTVFVIISFLTFAQDTVKNRSLDYEQYKAIQSEKFSGKYFRQFKVKTSDSTTFSNFDLKDKIVFVNFWFESCPPCISELEGFNKLFDTLRSNKDFMFISFTFDADSVINKMKTKYDIKFKVFHIEKPECYRLNFNTGFPCSFILDKNGIIRYSKIGGEIDKEKSTKEVATDIYPKIVELL